MKKTFVVYLSHYDFESFCDIDGHNFINFVGAKSVSKLYVKNGKWQDNREVGKQM